MTIPSAYFPRKTFADLARALRCTITTKLILTGRIVTPEDAEAVLASGVADFVGMTRALIADSELPLKSASGRRDEVRVCMGSGEGCIDRLYFGATVSCVQNATIGRETVWGPLERTTRARRIAIVGAGPAGMETARIAAERGHRVVLFEREREVGGAIRFAARAPGWRTTARSSIGSKPNSPDVTSKSCSGTKRRSIRCSGRQPTITCSRPARARAARTFRQRRRARLHRRRRPVRPRKPPRTARARDR